MPKRKREADTTEIVKTVFVPESFEKSPTCPHGPQILFEKNGKRFYACSAFRDRKECEKNAAKVVNKQSNSGLAQYLFDNESTDLLVNVIKSLNRKHVLCLGVPSVHERLLSTKDFHSFLLDIDQDKVSKYPESSCHYNMCNHYFFEPREGYEKFMKTATDLVIVMDPPFGVKPEVLSHVHGLIQEDFRRLSSGSGSDCQTYLFWIAPYFLEGHIKKANATLLMSDYQVNYSNHASFCKGRNQSRKHGSPIRFFTNVPLNLISLPQKGYKLCKACDKYVADSNRHCEPCGACTSKDGQTYRHCSKCKRCVKPTWSHCNKCKKCVLTADHVCR